MSEIVHATSNDETMKELKELTREGWPNTRADVPISARPYWNYRHEINLNDGLLFRGDKLLIPAKMRPSILRQVHNAHLGVEKCKRRARDVMFWPQMNAEIEDLISKCSICNTHRRQNQREPLQPHEIPQRPWEKLGADLFEWNRNDYLILIDYYSGYFEISHVSNTKSETIITHFKSQFARHGIPDVLITDNGPQFTSTQFEEFSKLYQFNHITSSPYHPQSNGMAEKGVQIAKSLLIKANESGQDPYLALLDYRNTPRDDILGSPVQRLFGRRTKTLLPTTEYLLRPQTVKPEAVTKQLTEKRHTQKSYYDRQTKELPELEAGDNVRVETDKGWKPAVVVSKTNEPRSYEIETSNGVRYRRNRRHLHKTKETFTDTNEADDLRQTTSTDADNPQPDKDADNDNLRRSVRLKTKPQWHKDYVM